MTVLIALCFWKFISWAIALGSGTSGGTLAPLLTIGSSLGCLLGMVTQQYFPQADISLPMSALVGMAAMFAGSARALLTSIVFAMETTMQESTLLPLIAGCVTSYLVSFILMRSTIMTEKIQRRGITLPDSYHPDLLEVTTVSSIMRKDIDAHVVEESLTIKKLKNWLSEPGLSYKYNTLLVSGKDNNDLLGTVHRIKIAEYKFNEDLTLSTLMTSRVYSVYDDNSLQIAVEFMLKVDQDVLPVMDRTSKNFIGVVTEADVLKVFEQRFREQRHMQKHISMRAATRRMLGKVKK